MFTRTRERWQWCCLVFLFCFDLNFTDYGSFGSISFALSLSFQLNSSNECRIFCVLFTYLANMKQKQHNTAKPKKKSLNFVRARAVNKVFCLSFFGCNDAYFCMLVNLQSNSISMFRGCAAHKQHDHLRMLCKIKYIIFFGFNCVSESVLRSNCQNIKMNHFHLALAKKLHNKFIQISVGILDEYDNNNDSVIVLYCCSLIDN